MHHLLLFALLCNLVWFAIVYLKKVFTEYHTDAERQYQSEKNLIQLLSLEATAQTNETIKAFSHSNKQKNRDNYTEHRRTHHD